LILAFTFACSKNERSEWYIDPGFSNHLLGFSRHYELRTKQIAADAVDVLQIFKTNQGRDQLSSVNEIRSREWVYETTRREDIAAFFGAVRNILPDSKRCNLPSSGVVYLILAFDRDLMRVGYLKYYPCAGYDLGALTAYGTSSLYFSSDIAKTMNTIIGVDLHASAFESMVGVASLRI
jgi:hypothetical protein